MDILELTERKVQLISAAICLLKIMRAVSFFCTHVFECPPKANNFNCEFHIRFKDTNSLCLPTESF